MKHQISAQPPPTPTLAKGSLISSFPHIYSWMRSLKKFDKCFTSWLTSVIILCLGCQIIKSILSFLKDNFLLTAYCLWLGRYFKCPHSVFKCKHISVCWFHTEVGGHLSTHFYMEVDMHFVESVFVKKLTPLSTLYFFEMDNQLHLKSSWDFHAS